MMDAAALDDFSDPNYTDPPFPNVSNWTLEILQYRDNFITILNITVSVICTLGAVGNGAVIWLLGFRIKRNPFMTYILNLAVADLGVLLSTLLDDIVTYSLYIDIYNYSVQMYALEVFIFLFLLMYSASQCLLTAISIDRCVAVFFPLWHQCKRPPHLTTFVCTLMWVLSALLTAITRIIHSIKVGVANIEDFYQFIVNAVLCLPVMAVATVSLFIKVCLKARQPRRGRLLTIVLVTLLFFLLCAFPLNVIYILSTICNFPEYIDVCAHLLACLNSSVNPVIYFLVGRQRKSRRKESMKMILQKAFKEEEGHVEEIPVETYV